MLLEIIVLLLRSAAVQDFIDLIVALCGDRTREGFGRRSGGDLDLYFCWEGISNDLFNSLLTIIGFKGDMSLEVTSVLYILLFLFVIFFCFRKVYYERIIIKNKKLLLKIKHI